MFVRLSSTLENRFHFSCRSEQGPCGPQGPRGRECKHLLHSPSNIVPSDWFAHTLITSFLITTGFEMCFFMVMKLSTKFPCSSEPTFSVHFQLVDLVDFPFGTWCFPHFYNCCFSPPTTVLNIQLQDHLRVSNSYLFLTLIQVICTAALLTTVIPLFLTCFRNQYINIIYVELF
ncbi:hypothetical protein D915_011118 [Fasciola hepatica]|uniref:Uncharacterized protein n=1 Tax=Fasciola hepatica TaxID=6192 RepID=A0A4E0QU59_FASHE|nr:hypothetical protein D915_011118 [Fasciola hepatica]